MCKAYIKGKKTEFHGEFRSRSVIDSSVAGIKRINKVYVNYSRSVSSKTNAYVKK